MDGIWIRGPAWAEEEPAGGVFMKSLRQRGTVFAARAAPKDYPDQQKNPAIPEESAGLGDGRNKDGA